MISFFKNSLCGMNKKTIRKKTIDKYVESEAVSLQFLIDERRSKVAFHLNMSSH